MSAIQQAQALGYMPYWTFDASKVALCGESKQEHPHQDKIDPLVEMPQIHEFDNVLAEVVSEVDDLDTTHQYLDCPEYLPLLLALKKARHWGVLYKAFLKSPAAKGLCCQLLNVHILRTKTLLHTHKSGLLKIQALPEADTKDWEIRLSKKFVSLQPSTQPIVFQVDPVCSFIDLTQVSVLQAAEAMFEVRKTLNTNFKQNRKAIQHLTVFQWSCGATFAINQKDDSGKGTTRILTPNIGQSSADERVRVLDLSYGEIWQGLQSALQRMDKGAEQNIAKALIAMVKGENPGEHVKLNQELKLFDINARFMYGARIDSGCLLLDQRWWVSRKKHKIDCTIMLGDLLNSMTTIVFIAEPRHARAMIPVTLLQLQEVECGYLRLEDLFGNMEGAIEYGRLLAGANYIGPKLKNVPVSGDWLKVAAIWDIVKTRVPQNNMDLVKSCPLSDLRMVLGDSPAYEIASLGSPCHSASLAISDPVRARAPEYQVLMKELFTVFICLLTRAGRDANIDFATLYPFPEHSPNAVKDADADEDLVAIGHGDDDILDT